MKKLLILTACIAIFCTFSCTKDEQFNPEPETKKWEFTLYIPSQNKTIILKSYKIEDNLGSWNNNCNCHPVQGTVAHLTGNYGQEKWYMLIIENTIKNTVTITGSVDGVSYIISTIKSDITFCDDPQHVKIVWNIKKQ